MSIANLKKYQPAISRRRHDDEDDEAVMRLSDSGYVKFEEAMEASSNSLQQLKAEIAALANDLNSYNENDLTLQFLSTLVTKLRQLSAV